jgi:hypothetical protein
VAVEITQPAEGGNFGPGVSLSITETAPGPFPDTDVWRVELYSGPTFETLERTASLPFVPGSFNFEWLNQSAFFDIAYTGGESGRLTTGSSVRIVARHQNSVGAVIGQDSATFVWQTDVGIGWQNATTQELVGGSGGTGGFTAEDRTTIEATEQQTLAEFPSNTPGLPSLISGIGELIEHIGPNLIVPVECADRTGRGSLVRPGGALNVNAYGLTWSFTFIPPGFGRRDGALEVWHERILQLVRIDSDRGGNDYLGDVFDIHTDGGRLVWGFGIPKQILYDVTPGCIVRICWLIL